MLTDFVRLSLNFRDPFQTEKYNALPAYPFWQTGWFSLHFQKTQLTRFQMLNIATTKVTFYYPFLFDSYSFLLILFSL
jgi:hypothetical protein